MHTGGLLGMYDKLDQLQALTTAGNSRPRGSAPDGGLAGGDSEVGAVTTISPRVSRMAVRMPQKEP